MIIILKYSVQHKRYAGFTCILRDFKNAPFYILCLFHMGKLRMFSLSFLIPCTMDHDLPLFRFAHAVHSDVISM